MILLQRIINVLSDAERLNLNDRTVRALDVLGFQDDQLIQDLNIKKITVSSYFEQYELVSLKVAWYMLINKMLEQHDNS